MLGEPNRTQYDLNFNFLGFDVRVHPGFWLVALILGFPITGGRPENLLMWTGAMFASILIHELGHTLAFQRCGISSHIVLYHFGGVAVPNSMYGMTRPLAPRDQIFISAAGPALQLALAGVVILLVRGTGHYVAEGAGPVGFLGVSGELFWGTNGERLANESLNELCYYILWPSIYWAVLNLAPLYPLDGGHISREIFVVLDPQQGIRRSLWLSVIAGVAIAIWGLTQRKVFLALMFGSLAFSSWQMLQGGGFGGGGFGGGFGGGGYSSGNPWGRSGRPWER